MQSPSNVMDTLKIESRGFDFQGVGPAFALLRSVPAALEVDAIRAPIELLCPAAEPPRPFPPD